MGEPGRGSDVPPALHSLPLPSSPAGSMQKKSAHLWWTDFSACQRSPVRTFLTALSAEHFESVQNAITESLDITMLSTAVYPI